MAARILVVDDEEPIRELIRFSLVRAGFEAVALADGASCLNEVRRLRPDLIVLDVMLPDADGFELYRSIREERSVPVIFVTARDEEFDRVLGLELGADDYLTKPFSPRELVARVRAVLRRTGAGDGSGGGPGGGSEKTGTLAVGRHLLMDQTRREVRRDGQVVSLTPREYELMAFMVCHPGRALSRNQLLDGVWGTDYVGESRIVDVHIRHLREKLEEDPANPRHILTVRGFGYRLEVGDN